MSSTIEQKGQRLYDQNHISILRAHDLPVQVPYYTDKVAGYFERTHPGTDRFVTFLLANLERVKRQGGLTKLWQEPGVILEESTAEHIRTILNWTRPLYGRNPEFSCSVDRNELLPLILIHDGGEQLDGDFPQSVEMSSYARMHSYLRSKPEVLGQIGLSPEQVEWFIAHLQAGQLPPDLERAFQEHIVTRFKHEYFEQQLPFMEKLLQTLPPEYASRWMQLLRYFEHRKETLYQHLGLIETDNPVSLADLRTITMGRFLDIFTEMGKFTTHGSWDWRNYQDALGRNTVPHHTLRMNSVELSFTRFMEPAVLMEYLLQQDDGLDQQELNRMNAVLVRSWAQHAITRVGEIEVEGGRPWLTAAEQAYEYYMSQVRAITTRQFSPEQFYAELDLFNHRTGSPPIWAKDLIHSQVHTLIRNRVA